MRLNCCVLLTLVGFQPWSKFRRNGFKCCCINFALHVRSLVLVPCWQGARPASLATQASPAAHASWARNNIGCWAFLIGKVGNTKGNCGYTKHNVWLLGCSPVHSLGSISLQELTMSGHFCPYQHYSPCGCSGSVCCQPVPPTSLSCLGQ